MSAILEAPTTAAEVDTGGEIPHEFQSSSKKVRLSAITILRGTGFFPGKSLKEPGSLSPRRGSFFPRHDDHGPGTRPPQANPAILAHSSASPQALIQQPLGAGLLREFDALYHKYVRRVYRQCFHMLRNPEDAEDLTQEVFLQLFRKAHTFRGEANFSTWLHRLTVNTVLMRLRRQRRWREALTSLDAAPGLEEGMSDILTKVSALHAPATNRLDKISLDVAIAQLPSGYREIFILHDVEGYRHDEIAKLLGISEGTSKSQLHKARYRLRELIGSAGLMNAGARRAPTARNRRKKGEHCPRVAEFAFA